ncbi:MAG: hypothetical protein Q4D63_02075 [Neisseria animaloris]|nr:hypothetical protein [Neisseria animaloris]
MMSFDDWKIGHLDMLKEKNKLSQTERMISDLNLKADKSKIEINALNKLLQTEYRKQKAEQERNEAIKYENEKQKQLLQALKKQSQKEAYKKRQQRAHELITIGSITELLGFPKDRGIVTGALNFVLEKMKQDEQFSNTIKLTGNQILKEREEEKNSQKMKWAQNRSDAT